MKLRDGRNALMFAVFIGTLASATVTFAKPVPAEPTYGEASSEAARAMLNRQQARDAQKQLADNAASRSASEAAALAREDQIRNDQSAWEAEKARLATEHAAAMDQWRPDVVACRDGDRTRCRHR